jgi:ADP-ribose pyrophosphatase YjhB (NUDIX family)
MYYFNPAIAVAAIIVGPDRHVLFIRRAKDPAQGKLAMPGGFVDINETAEAALRREVKEEVNLNLDAVAYLMSHPNSYHYGDITYPVLDFFFTCKVSSWNGAVAKSEVDSFVLRDPREIELEELAFDSMRHALRCFLKLRGG